MSRAESSVVPRLALIGITVLALAAASGCETTASGEWSTPTSAGPRQTTAPPPSPLVAAPSPAPSPTAGATRYVFPVSGTASYARVHHDYPASDIMAACGLPVLAATDGVVAEVSRVDRFDAGNPRGEDKGGLFVSIIGNDGVRYYGAHLSAVDGPITPGVRVTAGTRLGQVGSTGNSGACHLHFGVSPPCAGTGDWWTRRGVVWPWPYLDAWRAGRVASPAGEVAGWQRGAGCPSSHSGL